VFRKALTFIMSIFIIVGFGVGIYFAFFSDTESVAQKTVDNNIFGNLQKQQLEITEFFTYGKSFNLSGKIYNISKDNFESVKLYLIDGKDFEKIYSLNAIFDDKTLIFSTTDTINNNFILDDLPVGNYVLLVRLKLNNNMNPKYYSLKNFSQYENIEYYTVSKNDINKKVEIKFNNKDYNSNKYTYLGINIVDAKLPDDIYDIVIDAGHGRQRYR